MENMYFPARDCEPETGAEAKVVSFGLPLHRLADQRYRDLLVREFELDYPEVDCLPDVDCRSQERVQVYCLPTEFAEFLIARNLVGIPNMFAELEPRVEDASVWGRKKAELVRHGGLRWSTRAAHAVRRSNLPAEFKEEFLRKLERTGRQATPDIGPLLASRGVRDLLR